MVNDIDTVLFSFSLRVKRGSKLAVDRCYRITKGSNKCIWNDSVLRLKKYFGTEHQHASSSSFRNVKQNWTKESVQILKKHRLGKYAVRFARIAQILNDAASRTAGEFDRLVVLLIGF